MGQIITGSTPSTKDSENYSSNDYCFIKPSDLPINNIGRISFSEYYLSNKGYKLSRHLPKGTVLVSCIGSIGKIGILEVEATCNQQINAIIPNINIDSCYLAYSIYSIKEEMIRKANAPVVPIINKTDFSSFQVPVPPKEVQIKIVTELDSISESITLLQKQVKDLDSLSQSIFYSTFGDPITNPLSWPVKNMVEVAPCVAYKGDIKPIEGKYWLLNLDLVESQTGNILGKYLCDANEIGNSTSCFSEDNVLYSKLRPYLNKVVLPNDKGYCTSELLPLLPKKDCLDRVFLALLLRSNSFVNYINNRVAGAKMPRVSMNDFRNFNVILPPLSLQQSFASQIAFIEDSKASLNAQIKEIQDLLAARMQYWFE